METTIQLNGFSYKTDSEVQIKSGDYVYDSLINDVFICQACFTETMVKVVETDDFVLNKANVPPISDRTEEPTTPKENCDAECGGFSTDQNHVCCRTPKEQLTIKPKIQELKTWAEYFEKVLSGEKKFEVRENDRNFQEGDLLKLIEVVPSHQGTTLSTQPTGRFLMAKVDYVLKGSKFFGVDEKTCIMSISVGWTPPTPKGEAETVGKLADDYARKEIETSDLGDYDLQSLRDDAAKHFIDGFNAATQPESTNPNRPKERVFTESEKETAKHFYLKAVGLNRTSSSEDAFEEHWFDYVNQNHK